MVTKLIQLLKFRVQGKLLSVNEKIIKEIMLSLKIQNLPVFVFKFHQREAPWGNDQGKVNKWPLLSQVLRNVIKFTAGFISL